MIHNADLSEFVYFQNTIRERPTVKVADVILKYALSHRIHTYDTWGGILLPRR